MSKLTKEMIEQLDVDNVKDVKKQLKKAAKKAAKKAKKEYEQKLKALEELGNAHREAVVLDPAVMEAVDKLPARKEEPPKARQWTAEENKQFAMRIQNEKRNIWRVCKQDPLEIIRFCEENVADERNPAVRFARRDALKWAKAQQPMPYQAAVLFCILIYQF